MFLLNAFSTNMVGDCTVAFVDISAAAARQALEPGFTSAVGHADTAAVFSDILGIGVHAERSTVALKTGDRAVIGQYSGPRLPEGATQLPEGARIRWIMLRVL